jgi:hypothetical protein
MSTVVLEFKLHPDQLERLRAEWASIRDQAEKQAGVLINPDGSFNGGASGRIELKPDKAVVTITDKPWFVSISAINEKLEELFRS